MEAVSWRELRTCTEKQCDALDFLTNQGEYAKTPLATPMLLAGGGGFGSKSYTLRTAAVEILLVLRSLGFPNQRVAIFSDNMPNVHARQSVEIQQEWGDFAVVRGSQSKGQHVEFYGPGWENLGIISLRGMAEASKAGGRKGAQYAAILFDELTLITYTQFGELMYMRRSGKGLPFCSFGGATNPDGQGNKWVKELWVGPSSKYPDVPERRNYSEYSDAIKKTKHCFYYIPMLKADNPSYQDATVRETVDQNMGTLEPTIRRAREDGDWDIYLGGRFTSYSEFVHRFEWSDFLDYYAFPAGETQFEKQQEALRILEHAGNFGFDIWGSFDYGTSIESASSFHLHAVDPDKNIWTFFEWYRSGMNLIPQARLLGPIVRKFKPRAIYCDPALLAKKSESEDGKSRIQQFREADPDLRLRPGNNDRISGWSTLEMLLEWGAHKDEAGFDLLAQPNRSHVRLEPRWRIHSSCSNLHRQLATAPSDKVREGDVDHAFADDHAIDDVRYFLHTRYNAPVRRQRAPQKFSLAWMMQQRKAQKERDAWD